MKHVILYGYKGCGKTHFGVLLAQETARVFIDTDREIEKLYSNTHKEPLSCRQIAHKLGMEGFRKLEKQVIHSLRYVVHTPAVISVGGGAVLDQENCLHLQKLGKLIYLESTAATIQEQILKQGIPAFLSVENPLSSFYKNYEERKQIYETLSPYKISLEGKTEREVLHTLQLFLKEISS